MRVRSCRRAPSRTSPARRPRTAQMGQLQQIHGDALEHAGGDPSCEESAKTAGAGADGSISRGRCYRRLLVPVCRDAGTLGHRILSASAMRRESWLGLMQDVPILTMHARHSDSVFQANRLRDCEGMRRSRGHLCEDCLCPRVQDGRRRS